MTGLFTAAILSACTNGKYEGADRAGSKLTVKGIISNTLSRVGTTGMVSSWESGDAIGVSTTGNGTDFFNMKYTTDESGNFSAANGDIYLLSEGIVGLNAYYPYKEDTELSGGIYPFSIKDDNHNLK